MKKVLIISYVFPPTGGAGVQRISKFVKNLVKFDWTISVLTALNPSVPTSDDSLLSDIPESIQIYRSRTLEPKYTFKSGFKKNVQESGGFFGKLKEIIKTLIKAALLPDPQVLWWPLSSISLFQIILKNKIDVIFVSGPPFSALLFAVFWGKLFKIPVVSDFRDEWTFSRNTWEHLPKLNFIRHLDRKFEKYVVKNSIYITVASPFYEKDIKKNYGIKNCETITNGFDREDFKFNKNFDHDFLIDENKINFVYSGTVWSATSLCPFIKALENLIAQEPALTRKIQLLVIGRVVPEEEYYFRHVSKLGIVKLLGYIDHDLLIQYISSADILLLSLANLHGSEKIIPGKIFEYMMCKAPVLSMIPNGACSEIISKIKGFYIVDPDNIDTIEKIISDFAARPKKSLPVNKTGIEYFSRYYLTKQLSHILDVSAGHH
ncbi:MAG: glycosyltransferase [Desulfobacteraceae bacterium]|nr:MAG: glycosyltransferase [Desulfobacteraceae bacterium]